MAESDSAIGVFLESLIDYAGLFPPAALPMPSVAKNFDKYRNSDDSWMLGRLIVPALKLTEFASIHEQLFPGAKVDADNKWLISSLVPPIDSADDGFAAALAAIESFNDTSPVAVVDTIEGKVSLPENVPATVEQIPEGIQAFLEVPVTESDACLEAIASCGTSGVHAKVRTGGVTEQLIPAVNDVAEFIANCHRHGVGFKATAGLHHPVRASFPLTYQTDAPHGVMHGFLNLFTAACFARTEGWSASRLAEVLACEDPDQFVFQEDALTFSGHRLEKADIAATRTTFAISFGSCSFTEPTTEIRRTGWLGAEEPGAVS